MIVTLAYEELHPLVRIAHRVRGPINIGTRIIFDHELVLISSGDAKYTFGGDDGGGPDESGDPAEITLWPGDLLFIPPFLPHSVRSHGSRTFEHVAIHFDPAPGVRPIPNELVRRKPYEVWSPPIYICPG